MNQRNKCDVIEIIETFRGRLADEWLNEYRGDAEHGEWGMALENLCAQLEEFDVVPNQQEYQAISEAGERMGLDPQRWTFLAPRQV